MKKCYAGFNSNFPNHLRKASKLIIPTTQAPTLLQGLQLFSLEELINTPKQGLTTYVLDEEKASIVAQSNRVDLKQWSQGFESYPYYTAFLYSYFLFQRAHQFKLDCDIYLPDSWNKDGDMVISCRNKVSPYARQVDYTASLITLERQLESLCSPNQAVKMKEFELLKTIRELLWKHSSYPTLE